MWNFSEKEIERYLTRKKILKIGRRQHLVLRVQFRISTPEKFKSSIQLPLFQLFLGEKKFSPIQERRERTTDVLTRRHPKKHKELVIFEIKKDVASVSHVAQLRQYLNIVRYAVRNNIDGINKQLGITRSYKIKGILLARAIPQDVWFSTNNVYAKSPEIELMSYEIKSDRNAKRIMDIRFLNVTEYYRKEFALKAKKYKSFVKVVRRDDKIHRCTRRAAKLWD